MLHIMEYFKQSMEGVEKEELASKVEQKAMESENLLIEKMKLPLFEVE